VSDWAASIVSSDFSQRVDISASLISLSGVVRHLAGGEWSAELKPSVFSALKANWPGQDEAPLLLMLRWADNRLGTILSGPIRTATLERDGGVSKLTIGGVDEYAGLLGSRVVWPQPADLPPWTTDAKPRPSPRHSSRTISASELEPSDRSTSPSSTRASARPGRGATGSPNSTMRLPTSPKPGI
jgi:hypothetical protein